MDMDFNDELQQFNEIYQFLIEFALTYSFQILGAILIFIIGFIVAGRISKMVLGLCERKNLDITLSRFLASLIKLIVMALIIIIVLGQVGISVAPFVAVFGALSLGAGLAVQGLLSNYSAGLNIIVTRPFVVGDTISVQGVSGQVKEVRMAATLLTNEDDEIITIPNRHIVGEIITNSFSFKLSELSIGIAYHEDPLDTVSKLKAAISDLADVPDEKPPIIGIETFADSSINLAIRVWVPTKQFYELTYEINQVIYKTLKDNDIDIPFPQREVRLLEKAPSADT